MPLDLVRCTRRTVLAASAIWPLAAAQTAPAASLRPQRAVLIHLVGGASQLDTWDPKPAAPAEIRSPFQAISTRIPGVAVTELFPRLAQRADRLALVRGVWHDELPLHEAGVGVLYAGSSAAAARRPLGRSRGNDRYGNSLVGGELLAVREALLAGETTCVALCGSLGAGRLSWDAHAQPRGHTASLADYRVLGPALDQALAALFDDLYTLGLASETLVVVASEHGRTPVLNRQGGRDHWPRCGVALRFGAGAQPGVCGQSDALGGEPVERPTHLRELATAIALAQSGQPPCAQALGASSCECL